MNSLKDISNLEFINTPRGLAKFRREVPRAVKLYHPFAAASFEPKQAHTPQQKDPSDNEEESDDEESTKEKSTKKKPCKKPEDIPDTEHESKFVKQERFKAEMSVLAALKQVVGESMVNKLARNNNRITTSLSEFWAELGNLELKWQQRDLRDAGNECAIELTNLKQEDAEDAEDYVYRASTLLKELQSYGGAMGEQQLIDNILLGLDDNRSSNNKEDFDNGKVEVVELTHLGELLERRKNRKNKAKLASHDLGVSHHGQHYDEDTNVSVAAEKRRAEMKGKYCIHCYKRTPDGVGFITHNTVDCRSREKTNTSFTNMHSSQLQDLANKAKKREEAGASTGSSKRVKH